MAAVLSPLHMHLASAQTLVLEEVRRAPVAAPVREIHVATAIGHIHGSTPKRHLHGRGDPSVMPLAGDALQQAGDADEAGASASAEAFFGILPTVVSWLPSSPQRLQVARALVAANAPARSPGAPAPPRLSAAHRGACLDATRASVIFAGRGVSP